MGSPVCKKPMSQSLFFETQSKFKHILHLQSFNIMSCFIFNWFCIFLGETNTKQIFKKKKTGLLGSKMCRVCIFACFLDDRVGLGMMNTVGFVSLCNS